MVSYVWVHRRFGLNIIKLPQSTILGPPWILGTNKKKEERESWGLIAAAVYRLGCSEGFCAWCYRKLMTWTTGCSIDREGNDKFNLSALANILLAGY